jgi:opacity protein-like surface antigen
VFRLSMAGPLVAAGLACVLGTRPVAAQLVETHQPRFELTPFVGYQWGGSFETFANGTIPAGELELSDELSYGGILGFVATPESVLELTYLREDANISFNRAAGATTDLGGFAVNYFQLGGRFEFGPSPKLRPFVTVSAGIGIFDPKTEGISSDTKFSWSLGAGTRYKLGESDRAALRFDARLWVTPVPSGDYGVWCDFYGCFAAEGTAWVTQGTLSGGLMFSF